MSGNTAELLLRDVLIHLGYSGKTVERYAHLGVRQKSIEAFLLRFIQNNDTVESITTKLLARRAFERTLPCFSLSAGMLEALRSGAFHVLGRSKQQQIVFYISLRRLSIPSLESDEVQRLFLVLMEYMQLLVLRETAVSVPSSEASAATQSFLLVINQEGAEWAAQQALLTMADSLYTLYTKYYPNIISQALIVGAPPPARTGITTCISSFSKESKKSVVFIQRDGLKAILDEEALPTELGGQYRMDGGGSDESGVNFSDQLLRHWYTLTTFLMEEEADETRNEGHHAKAPPEHGAPAAGFKDGSRPLYMLPPQRMVAASPHLFHNAPLGAGARLLRSRRSLFSSRSGFNTPETSKTPREDETEMCSFITDLDSSMTCERTEFIMEKESTVKNKDNDHDGSGSLDPDQLQKAYRYECAMRKAAEQRLQVERDKWRNAIQPLKKGPNAREVEKALIFLHQDVHLLLADVVNKARSDASRGGPGFGSDEADSAARTEVLGQLLDTTIAALGAVAGVPSTLGAMKSAVPVVREEKVKSSCCCCCS